MRSIHLDAVGGVAGDMFVAALLDALPELRGRVLDDVQAVLPPGGGAIELLEGMSGAIRALRFNVTVGHHDHHHHHDHAVAGYPDIMARIAAAPLSDGTAEQAGAILTILGEAEAKIHAIPLDQVHFHEIADWDSLADVVAAGSIAAALAGTAWSVSDLPRGGGLVRTQHGMLPVPAPATADILTGFAWRDDGVTGERVTPTGAAILRHLVGEQRAPGTHALIATGTGAGTRNLPDMPNVLRALVFQHAAAALPGDRIAVIGFDVDDMTGEEIAAAAEHLRHHDGVLDVSIGQRLGKKGRPLSDFRILARPEALDAVRRLCLHHTSTIGLRWRLEDRAVLAREDRQAGGIRAKAATRPDGSVTVKAESDDLADADSLAERRRRQRLAEAQAQQ